MSTFACIHGNEHQSTWAAEECDCMDAASTDFQQMAGKRKSTRRFHRLRDEFFDEGKRHFEAGKRDAAACWICKADIDYNADPGTTPDSHTLDHFHPVEDRPDLQEDPSNFRHAHFSCNSARGKRAPGGGLGEAAPAWW